jgi:hypothetical protein
MPARWLSRKYGEMEKETPPLSLSLSRSFFSSFFYYTLRALRESAASFAMLPANKLVRLSYERERERERNLRGPLMRAIRNEMPFNLAPVSLIRSTSAARTRSEISD